MDKHLIQTMLAFGVLLIISVFASKTSSKFGIPSLLIFIIVGMIGRTAGVGSMTYGDIHFTKNLGIVALSFILFSGGMSTQVDKVRHIWKEGTLLATFGVFISTAVMALFIHLIMGWDWTTSALLGATMSSTDAAAVFGILKTRNLHLKPKVQSVLELESGSNDPIAFFLTISLVSLLTAPDKYSMFELMVNFVVQMVLGGILGLILGRILAKLINLINLEFEGLYPVLTIAAVVTIYAVTESLGGNGFLSVYLAGVAMGGERFYSKKTLGVFHDGLGWVMQVAMFLSLGLLVNPLELSPVIIPGVAMAAVLMILARPISILFCLLPFKYKVNEIWFISWGGLRGAVPIILATFAMDNGIPESRMMFNLVFFIVLFSLLIQGTSMHLMAKVMSVQDFTNHRPPPAFKSRRAGKDFIEYVVPKGSPIVGQAVLELDLPEDVLIVLIHRGKEEIIPRGNTHIEAFDRLVCLVGKKMVPKLSHMFRPPHRMEI